MAHDRGHGHLRPRAPPPAKGYPLVAKFRSLCGYERRLGERRSLGVRRVGTRPRAALRRARHHALREGRSAERARGPGGRRTWPTIAPDDPGGAAGTRLVAAEDRGGEASATRKTHSPPGRGSALVADPDIARRSTLRSFASGLGRPRTEARQTGFFGFLASSCSRWSRSASRRQELHHEFHSPRGNRCVGLISPHLGHSRPVMVAGQEGTPLTMSVTGSSLKDLTRYGSVEGTRRGPGGRR